MQFVGKMITSMSEFYKDINPSTLSGAIDVVVVEDVSSGELTCSPFHVRFGKLQLLRPQEKAVELKINGFALDEDLRMKVGEAGETFFVLPLDEETDFPSEYLTSPLMTAETPIPLESVEELKLVNPIEEKSNKDESQPDQEYKEDFINTEEITKTEENEIIVTELATEEEEERSGSGSEIITTIETTTEITEEAEVTTGVSNLLIEQQELLTSATISCDPNSPEWKWQWGDLPMKQSSSFQEENENSEQRQQGDDVTVKVTPFALENTVLQTSSKIEGINSVEPENENIITVPTTPDVEHQKGKEEEEEEEVKRPDLDVTVDLYEFLSGRNHISQVHSTLSQFPIKLIQTRIFKVDRGLHFYSLKHWPAVLLESPQTFLTESSNVSEGDFLFNPNLVIEDSSRLVYQFSSGDSERVLLSGSVGAAVVFYVQVYGRILPVELMAKLAEIASIRMAKKKKFNFESEGMRGTETVGETGTVTAEETAIEAKQTTVEVTTNSEQININSGSQSQSQQQEQDSFNLTSSPAQSASSLSTTEKLSTSLNLKSETSSSWRSWWRSSGVKSPSSSQQKSSDQITVPVSPRKNSNTPTLSSLVLSANSDGEMSPSKRVIQRTSTMSPTNSTASTTTTNNTTTPTFISSGAASPTVPKQPHLSINYNAAKNSSKCIKSLRLPSSMLKRLNLQPGVNTITYTVNTKLQGTATCQSRIFLWRSDARVVISDIDGTITKSDALGHLFTMVGRDWTHVGVASLYTKISKNGYEFLYLTSRAIGQAASTRGYLKGIEQDRFQLPDGPVIMSPDRLFTALHREVIQRRPDEFKIACLRDIQRLFVPNDEEVVSTMGSGVISSSEDEMASPRDRDRDLRDKDSRIVSSPSFSTNTTTNTNTSTLNSYFYNNSNNSNNSSNNYNNNSLNPFYAGFGNRPTDTKSYKAVGIPASRIYLINSAGDLKLEKLTFFTPYSASSYSKLTEEVDKIFPPLRSPSALTRVAGDEAFTDFQYWHGSGGDVRMDLVRAALIKARQGNNMIVDEDGRPMRPETLQLQLGTDAMLMVSSSTLNGSGSGTTRTITTTDNNNNSIYYSSSSSSSNSTAVTSPSITITKSEERDADADSENESSDFEDGTSVATISSFPFL